MFFEEHIISLERIDDSLRITRERLVKDLINRLNSRKQEWDETFYEILNRSQEEENDNKDRPSFTNCLSLDNLTQPKPQEPPKPVQTHLPSLEELEEPEEQEKSIDQPVAETEGKTDEPFDDPNFSNFYALREFLRVEETLNEFRNRLTDFKENAMYKAYRNELNLFIRTQINAISNSDQQHLNSKIRNLSNLFNGLPVEFQGRTIDVNRHSEARLFVLDLAAQTFVRVGTRLVNSVPAIARSMATVIHGVINNNNPIFRDLIIGHLQEGCPYLVPIYPDPELPEKIDTVKTRSMVLLFANILIQGPIGLVWSWLVSFLSLLPRPVITALVLQAFLQESSKLLSSTYGRYHHKLLSFIKNTYVGMIEEVTPKTAERQSLVKLKNIL